MRLRYFLYNAFLIEHAAAKIVIDPGLNLWIGKLNSLIPQSEWNGVTHIFATHGDALDVGETIDADGVNIQGLKSVHGPVVVYSVFGIVGREFASGPGKAGRYVVNEGVVR
jgi:hypothetical protein